VSTLTLVLIALAGGALPGALIAAISSFSPNRANAIKSLTEAVVTSDTRVQAMHTELVMVRQAMLALTDAVDEALPLINTMQVRRKLAKANTAAKLTA
jgi:hypothetical protein